MSLILGLSGYYHDSAAVLLRDGEIVAAAQEERFTRKKHDAGFPEQAARYVLKTGRCAFEDLDAVAFYDKPFLKFERLLETYHAFAPRGLASFSAAMPVWIKEKLFLRSELRKQFANLASQESFTEPPLYFPEHHLSHAASAFFPSPFTESAILTIDGVGEWATTSICKGTGNGITVLREMHFPHSLGLLYSAFTAYCGFKVNSGEYKLMGLAPYGRPDSEDTQRFLSVILDEMVDVREDGSYLLNMACFNYATGLTMFNEDKWLRLFGVPPRQDGEDDIPQVYMDMALAIQQATEVIVLKLASTAMELAESKNLCLAGGVALNCVANGKLIKQKTAEHVWIQPASGDAGGALGAALSVHYIHRQSQRSVVPGSDAMRGSYLGPEFSDAQAISMCEEAEHPYQYFADGEELYLAVAEALAEGKVVGWFQGRMEYGPRALGNRSILGDPRDPGMQKKLNLKIKYREGFRPFAPSVLEERANSFFDLDVSSPYMLLVAGVREELRRYPDEALDGLGMWDRLYFMRSSMPAVTHIDYSARVQTVSKATNPRYHALISAFEKLTSVPVLVNTSFNVRGEPIVCTPRDAYACFMHTEMDMLVLGNVLLRKQEMQAEDAGKAWREQFDKD